MSLFVVCAQSVSDFLLGDRVYHFNAGDGLRGHPYYVETCRIGFAVSDRGIRSGPSGSVNDGEAR